ncbi:hypothetical protein QBC44DRAFT_313556 [Cladorrhinum sp. PSN332]|nr:hypothetical protein QBC44DRAFT_313556 [Cladorrhinum sp. PSN332]
MEPTNAASKPKTTAATNTNKVEALVKISNGLNTLSQKLAIFQLELEETKKTRHEMLRRYVKSRSTCTERLATKGKNIPPEARIAQAEKAIKDFDAVFNKKSE